MKPIRREVSEIVGVLIPKDKWEAIFNELDKQGKLDQRHITQIILVILKRLEALEDADKR